MTRAQAIKLLCSLESGKSEVSVGNMREVWARLTDQIAREMWELESGLHDCLIRDAKQKFKRIQARAARAEKGKKR